MQFTPQQLAGAAKYSHKCRIGNWSEDVELEEVQLKDYILRKQRGALLVDKAIQRNELTLQPVPHSYNADGYVRFGDTVQIRCNATGGILANNLWDPLDFEIEAYCITTTPSTDPVARNTWVIARIPSEENEFGDDILHYGQNFMLACNPSLRVDADTGTVQSPYYLQSEIVSHSRSAKLSHNQVVCMVGGRPAYAMSFKCRRPATRRYIPEGDLVPADEELLIIHTSTNQALYSDTKYSLRNDYGVEVEVSAKTQQSVKKTHNLVGEWSGTTTADIPSRKEENVNRWSIVLARNPEAAVDNRGLVNMTPEMLFQKVRKLLQKRGNYGYRGLLKVFRLLDQAGDGKLDRVDFRFGLADYGVPLTDSEFDMLLQFFDKNGDGVIGLTEFMIAVREPMNAFRQHLVSRAYAVLDKTGDGIVTLEDVSKIWDASKHPDVTGGFKTEDEVLTEFLSQWDTQQSDGIVTLEEFTDYYGDISSTIDSDSYFEQMICTAWNMERGK